MKQNLKRDIALTFRVNEDERDLIRRKIDLAGIDSLRLYLAIMAIRGQIVRFDMSDVRECGKMLRSISNNVNQLAKRTNEGRGVCEAELSHLREKLAEVWEQQNKIIKALVKIVEAA